MRWQCFSRLLAILSKEVRQLRRDRLTFGMIVGIPIMQILLFGFAINTDVRHLRAAVVDEAGTALSRELLGEVAASQVVDIVAVAAHAVDLEARLRRGEIAVGIYIPPDFGRRIQDRRRTAAQLLVDGSDPTVLAVARQLVTLPFGYRTAKEKEPSAAVFEVRNHYNPERRSAVNIVPGLVGVILTMTMVLFTAVAIVREAERGNMELLINTPVRSLEIMLGKIIPYVVIGLLQVSLILLLGRYLFEVPIRGDLLQVYAASGLFIAANLTLGLVISTAAKSQFQAMQMTFFFFLPSILLSGFMFPFEGMPVAARYLAELLPLTHFVRLIRGIMLRGAGLAEMGPDLLALLVFSLVMLGFAVRRFRRTLD
jgi:ABC-2 type transport system permease protein